MRNDYIYDDGGRHQYFRMKYQKDRVGDCVIRALAIATGEDYKKIRKEVWELSWENGAMPNDKLTFDMFLQNRGWIKEKKIKGFTLGQYPFHPKHTYFVVLARHCVAVDQGLVRDIWDCRYKSPYYTWRRP